MQGFGSVPNRWSIIPHKKKKKILDQPANPVYTTLAANQDERRETVTDPGPQS